MLFVCGPAGTGGRAYRVCTRNVMLVCVLTGKSTFDRELVRRAAIGANGMNLVINCAPTGIAAHNLPGGVTLHSMFAINALSNKLIEKGPSVELAKARMMGARVIVLDEASMVDAVRVSQIDRRLRQWGDESLVSCANRGALCSPLPAPCRSLVASA